MQTANDDQIKLFTETHIFYSKDKKVGLRIIPKDRPFKNLKVRRR
jgi:hypothetical protein